MPGPSASGRKHPINFYDGEVAISGISGRLAESDNMEELRDNLMSKVDMITEDERRWKQGFCGLPTGTGKIKDVTKFDAAFFGVSPKQAKVMDPVLRMLLEVCYEAIVDSGNTLQSVRGSRTAVITGISANESYIVWMQPEVNTGYPILGCSRAMIANRISYAFDLTGPSYTVDTACSSSSMALDQALQMIRQGVCDSALVCGTNINISPLYAVCFVKLGMSSPDGRCKSFDASGDGYGRSEAVMAVFLQKTDDCKRIYATMVHSKANCDGYKEEGATFPSSRIQRRLMEEVYSEAGVSPKDVAYFECHGTGTSAGDPQELKAITEVFCKDRDKPLLIGTIKSNLGHTESPAGLSSVAKIIIAMQERTIPPNIHYKNPNPGIAGLVDGRLQVVTEPTKWSGGLMAMNSFGFGGANVHCLFRSYEKETNGPHMASAKPRLFTYVGRSEDGVRAVLQEAKKNAHSVEFQALLQEGANMPASQMPYRGCIVLNSSKDYIHVQKCSSERRPVWFVLSGMGSQWKGMGKKMMEMTAFKESILRSSEILRPHNIDPYKIIMEDDESVDPSVRNFIGIQTIQVALVDLLTAMGIKPDGIIGHSAGELLSGYTDGALTHKECLLASYWRGRCVSEAKLPPGKMAAVGLTWEQCYQLCPESIAPACNNCADTQTISGPADDMDQFMLELKAKGIFCREVDSSSIPYHSQHMGLASKSLKAAWDKVIVPKPRSSRWVSTVATEARSGEEWAQYACSEYYVNNVTFPVLFEDALAKIHKNAIVIEIGPHCLFQGIFKKSLSPDVTIVGLMKKGHENNIEFFLSNLGKCYANGLDMNPLKLFPPVEFPVPRGTPMISSCISKIWDHSDTWEIPKATDFLINAEQSASGAVFNVDISEDSPDNYLAGHKIDGRVTYPASGYLVLAWQALAKLRGQDYQKMPVVIENINIVRETHFNHTDQVSLSVSIMPGTGQFEVSESGKVVATGVVNASEGEPLQSAVSNGTQSPTGLGLTKEEVYKILLLKGYEYGPTFKSISRSNLTGERLDIAWTGRWVSFIDAMMQASLVSDQRTTLLMPTNISEVRIDPRSQPTVSEEGQSVDVPTYVNCRTKTVASGGVELQDVRRTATSRTGSRQAPLLGQYQFVPHIENAGAFPTYLETYATGCLNFILASLNRFLSEDKDGILPHREYFKKVMSGFKAGGYDLDQLKALPQSSLASVLEEKFSLPVNKELGTSIGSLLKNRRSELASDVLLSCLNTTEILSPCIDMVVDNVLGDKISVFEIGANSSTLYRKIVPIISSCPTKSAVYTGADIAELHDDAKEFGVKSSLWDPSTSSAMPTDQVNLLVLKNVLGKQKDIDCALQSFEKLITPNGFVLVEEVTTNFLIRLMLEDTIEDNVNGGRIFGSYLTQKGWEDMFAQHNYEIVYKKSDTVLSTMFLLRKKFVVSPAPAVLVVDDLCCSWLNDLKSELTKLASAPDSARLWLVSKNKFSGLNGLMAGLCKDLNPNKVRSLQVSNLNPSSQHPETTMDDPVFQKLVRIDLVNNVYRDGLWGSFRQIGIPQGGTQKEEAADYACVEAVTTGDLTSLRWLESPLKSHRTEQSRELCSVYYAAINPQDLDVALGTLPPIDSTNGPLASVDKALGMEFSGRDRKGKRVMGILPAKGLATAVEIEPRFLWDIPAKWTMGEAATVPVAYCTAYYALVMRGNVRKGQRVLIHSGNGAIGQAAIAVALGYGCEVFTNVTSDEDKIHLKKLFPQLKDGNVSSSRGSTFNNHILEATNGIGVDVVLTSPEEDKLQTSIKLLARNGRFVDIGNSHLNKPSALDASIFQKNISFCSISLDFVFGEEASQDWLELSNLLKGGISSGVVRPLHATIYNKDEVIAAFQYMDEETHSGKVLLQVRSETKTAASPAPVPLRVVCRSSCDPIKSYVIVGGLGGFGLELAKWLRERGASKLVLSSRSGIRSGYEQMTVQHLKDSGASVVVSKNDAATLEGANALLNESLKLGPVGGIFNIAAVSQDASIESQTVEMYQAVCEPRVKATLHLDEASRKLCGKSLQWFICFSSLDSGVSSTPGHTGSGFANASMERICELRKAEGHPALAVQWGAIGDVGLVADAQGGNEATVGGTTPQRMVSCLETLDQFLTSDVTVGSSYVLPQATNDVKEESDNSNALIDAVAKILGMKDSSKIDPDTSLTDLGMDSLMDVAIKQLLEKDLGVSLNANEIRTLNMNKLRDMSSA